LGEIIFEAGLKNSQCGSSVGVQTVPEASSSHQKYTVASSGQPCTFCH